MNRFEGTWSLVTSVRNHKCLYQFALLGGLMLPIFLPAVANADQIVVLTDGMGHRVFVNTGEIPAHVDLVARSSRTRSSSPAQSVPANIDQLLEETANRFQVDPALVRAVVRVESGYNAKAVSNKGAMGLMQLMPATAHRFGVVNAFDPKQNLEGGVTYLKYLLDLFGGDLNRSLAAYNSGEHAVQRAAGIPSIPETQDYVRKVTSFYKTANAPMMANAIPTEPLRVPIVRYVDEQQVVHFSNVD